MGLRPAFLVEFSKMDQVPGFAQIWARLPGFAKLRTRLPGPFVAQGQIPWYLEIVEGQVTWLCKAVDQVTLGNETRRGPRTDYLDHNFARLGASCTTKKKIGMKAGSGA